MSWFKEETTKSLNAALASWLYEKAENDNGITRAELDSVLTVYEKTLQIIEDREALNDSQTN